ncbi:hypothetical protein DFH08DRAFT_812546 [Mycena albidolilacea]|uniref:Reverse transcriptase zinc-binding domain-containing protein n=1 Tax=Mycena albidolilacea TaxID=1033008 RepID=A0AAD6ZTN5_9AGAR|nr:hypothetical protein DFH08DRAFT_812546 [Mycena albidolilacea]
MPLWHHPGQDPQKRQVNNGQKARCLRGKHAALTIGAGVDLGQRLDDPLHYRSASCVCDACEEDRTTRGCENPHACAIAAVSRLGQILPRWIPMPGGNEVSGPAATPPEEETNSELFTPPESIMVPTQGLRAMTRRQNEPMEHPDPPVRRQAVVIPTPATTTAYIAGATHTPPCSKKPSAAAGLFFSTDDIRNKGRCIPASGEQSQYVAELFAALETVRQVDTNSVLTIYSTQEYVCEAMNKKLSKWEHEGWVGVPHRDVLRCLAAELKARKAPTFFKLAAPGMPERLLCRQATMLAKNAVRAPGNQEWDFTLPKGTALPGLSLQGNRQRVFYRSIREEKTKKLTPRLSTIKTLDLVWKAAEDDFGRYASDTDIWRAVHAKDILPRTAQFLWKGIHNAHRIGKYWIHIPECKDCAICKECNVTEDLAHILVGCRSPGQEIIWEATRSLWLGKETQWPAVSLGTILGCGLADFRDERKKQKHGTQRLYRILMSESAYLIWKLQNDRVIS